MGLQFHVGVYLTTTKGLQLHVGVYLTTTKGLQFHVGVYLTTTMGLQFHLGVYQEFRGKWEYKQSQETLRKKAYRPCFIFYSFLQ